MKANKEAQTDTRHGLTEARKVTFAEVSTPIWKKEHLSTPLSIPSLVHTLLVAISGWVNSEVDPNKTTANGAPTKILGAQDVEVPVNWGMWTEGDLRTYELAFLACVVAGAQIKVPYWSDMLEVANFGDTLQTELPGLSCCLPLRARLGAY